MEEPEDKPSKPDPVNEIKLALRRWHQEQQEQERQTEIDKLLKDAGVKPQPDEPANPS